MAIDILTSSTSDLTYLSYAVAWFCHDLSHYNTNDCLVRYSSDSEEINQFRSCRDEQILCVIRTQHKVDNSAQYSFSALTICSWPPTFVNAGIFLNLIESALISFLSSASIQLVSGMVSVVLVPAEDCFRASETGTYGRT